MEKKINYFLILSLILLSGCAAKKSKKTKKPNIVYILADDLGYGDLGVYGQKKIETPNIDALAKHGMLFTQHYAFPVCAPSRYSLMTGKNSGHAYIRGNDEWTERGDVWNYKAMEANPALEGQLPIPDSTITIAKKLKKAGYKTAIIGKWGLGGPFTTGIPNNQGFDYFYGFLCQREDHTYYPGHLWENKLRVPLANNKEMSPQVKFPKDENPLDPENYTKYSQGDYAPKFIIQAALRFIQKNKNHPFFLYFASPLPHVSLQAPQEWIQYYHKKFGSEKPFLGGSYFPSRYPRATYAAMVSTLDEHVGEIVQKLREMGLYKNTIIVFTSDNGPTYNGGTDSPWFDSGGPFKSKKGWGKGYVHEGGIREPFIVSWPGKIKSGSKSDLISATWDAMPTFCEIAGIDPPANIDGISYLSTLLGHDDKQKKHQYLYWEFPGYGGQQAVRLGKWKGIRMNIKKKGNLKIQLFNLKEDIQEQHNVADQHPKVVQKIKHIMANEHTMPEVDHFKMKALEKGK
jgi:arylsulfatase